MASKRGSHNERFYEEYEYEKRLKKRRARLITAAEEAFTHIKRIQEDQLGKRPKQKFLGDYQNKSFSLFYGHNNEIKQNNSI